MSRHGLIADQGSAGVYVGFLAGVLATNQMLAKTILDSLQPLTDEEQVLVVKAVAFSGLPDWQEILADEEARMPRRKRLIRRYLVGERHDLVALPVASGQEVDALWGYYFATGAYQPMLHLIDTLKWWSERPDVEKVTVAGMAKWTLASNGARDPALMQLYYTEIEHAPEAVATPLKDVIEAAETFEFDRIRTEAHEAIAAMRQEKPPSETATWAFRTKVGQTAIALACVAASVTGHAEFGIPCVVTGALTGAASTLLSAQ
ncbi:MAG: hypothetical protein R3D33_06620 [Hyphomicrobiaceae bacterium]